MRTTLCALTVAMPLLAQAQPAPPQEPAPSAEPTPAAPATPVPSPPTPEAATPPVAEPVTAPAVSNAATSSVESEGGGSVGLLVGAKLGGIVPLDGLSPFAHVGFELGYVLPPMKRQLVIVLAVDYTQPTTTNEETDPRVMGGTYTWTLTEQELGVMATLVFRATSVKPLVPYGGIGPRILFARSKVQDNGAPMISTTKEQSTRVGVGIPLGAELRLGPGRAIGEILLQYGTLDHTATGNAHTGAVTLALGYRLVL